MRLILNGLKRRFPKDEIQLSEYSGTDPIILRMHHNGTKCYEVVRNGRTLPIMVYDFNAYGSEEEVEKDKNGKKISEHLTAFGFLENLTRYIKLIDK